MKSTKLEETKIDTQVDPDDNRLTDLEEANVLINPDVNSMDDRG